MQVELRILLKDLKTINANNSNNVRKMINNKATEYAYALAA